MITLTLPFPPKELNPNNRAHWRRKHRIGKAQKAIGFIAAYKHRMRECTGDIALSLTFYPKDNRHRDSDNMLASMKNAIDGIALGLGVDDRQFTPVSASIGDKNPCNPCVIVQLTLAADL